MLRKTILTKLVSINKKNGTVVTPGLLQKNAKKSVTVRGIFGFSSVFSRFFRKFDKKRKM